MSATGPRAEGWREKSSLEYADASWGSFRQADVTITAQASKVYTEQMNLGNQDNCKTLPLHPKETKEELQVSMVTLTQEKHPEKMNEQVEIGKWQNH